MRNKKIIWTFFLVLCFGVIFCFSNQNGTTSESLSDGVSEYIIDYFAKATKKEISNYRKEELVDSMRMIIRKSAHFTIYLILGIIMCITLKSYGIKHFIVLSILFCFFYACFDELHQIFIVGRDGRVLDVLIDTCGTIIGIYLIYLCQYIKNIGKSLI